MKTFLTRWAVNVIAIWVVFQFVPGVTPVATSLDVVIVNGLILGLVNLIVRPLLRLVTFPLIIATLGLGTLIINTCMFLLAGWIGSYIGYGFSVDGFVAAFVAALVVSIVTVPTNLVFRLAFR
ncbi:MAG: phage holin family protein [Chloroflexota bacterium]|nr:phage holin family protein [Chloroflexota bacterium]